MLSYQSKASLLLSLTMIIHSTSATLTTHCQIITDRNFQPNISYSLVSTTKLPSSSRPTITDCAHLCLGSRRCRTAVFESQQMTCALYSESATSSGSLVVNSTGHFSTIITEKLADPLIFVPSSVTVYPIWNTTAGQNSIHATSGYYIGQYWFTQSPNNVFDGDWSTPFCSYGVGATAFNASDTGGLNTGVYVTVPSEPFVLKAFRMVRGRVSSDRDPLQMTIEGSNLNGSTLTLGSSWTLIYNGTTGLDINPGDFQPGTQQTLSNNTLLFSSYRFLMTAHRATTTCIEYTEIEMYQQ